jgi:hypothetical protein
MRSVRLLVALFLAFYAAATLADTAGQVLFAYGETHALRDGRIIQLHAGSSVESGDQLHTGVESYLQVRFTDWGVMSLRPRTDFVIDEYAYEQRAGGAERAFFSLLAGGVRSVTGLIGHRDRRQYRLRTTMNSIGIRGTHYSVLICNRDCKLDDGSLGEDGVYGGVTEGRIAVSPYGGKQLEREFGAGEYFRLASPTSVPEPFVNPPAFFWDRHEPQAGAGGRTFAGIPWKPAPAATLTDASGSVAGGAAGSLVRTDGSLTLSPITAPVLNQVAVPVLGKVGSVAGSTVSTVGGVVAPVTPVVGSTVGSVLNPLLGPVAPVLASTIGSLITPVVAPVVPIVTPVVTTVTPVVGPIVAPVAPVVTPIVAPIAPVVTPIVAPVAPVVTPIVAPVAPVVTPIVAPVAPVVTPIVAPVAPVVTPIVAPVAPVVTPIVAPVAPIVAPIIPPVVAPTPVVVTPPPPAVTLPTVPSLPVVSGLSSLLPKR